MKPTRTFSATNMTARKRTNATHRTQNGNDEVKLPQYEMQNSHCLKLFFVTNGQLFKNG